MARRSKNSILILVVLLVVIAIVAWSCTRKKNENMLHAPPQASSSHTSSIPQMPIRPQNSPQLDYEMIYGNPQDSFGVGPGASVDTTNEWTLLG